MLCDVSLKCEFLCRRNWASGGCLYIAIVSISFDSHFEIDSTTVRSLWRQNICTVQNILWNSGSEFGCSFDLLSEQSCAPELLRTCDQTSLWWLSRTFLCLRKPSTSRREKRRRRRRRGSWNGLSTCYKFAKFVFPNFSTWLRAKWRPGAKSPRHFRKGRTDSHFQIWGKTERLQPRLATNI